jgi:hypothetical protein
MENITAAFDLRFDSGGNSYCGILRYDVVIGWYQHLKKHITLIIRVKADAAYRSVTLVLT